uniref:Uncharacterized protein n=1 Tax=Timema douglasi TaxID=61478 RepID=A0A7R8Z2P3_TIMDO|nr:unnamed protein product [Timema douglasi]
MLRSHYISLDINSLVPFQHTLKKRGERALLRETGGFIAHVQKTRIWWGHPHMPNILPLEKNQRWKFARGSIAVHQYSCALPSGSRSTLVDGLFFSSATLVLLGSREKLGSSIFLPATQSGHQLLPLEALEPQNKIYIGLSFCSSSLISYLLNRLRQQKSSSMERVPITPSKLYCLHLKTNQESALKIKTVLGGARDLIANHNIGYGQAHHY